MRKWFLVLICLVVLAGALPLRADPVIVGEGPLSYTGGLGVGYTQWIAKQFTLNDAYQVTNIAIWGSLSGNSTFYLTSALNSGSVIFQTAISGSGEIDVPMALALNAGTYYIVLGVVTSGGGLWSGPYPPFHIENGGTVGSTFAAYSNNPPIQQSLDSTWYSQGDYPTAFTVNGTLANVPEPAGIFLFGSGLMGLAAMVRRKLRR